MICFRSIVAALALLALAAPAAAQKLSLAEISAYLNDMSTAQAEFTQINDDGSISTGEIFISRPGRIRFQYDPPDAGLVLATRGQVAVFDAKSNQRPQRFPLNKTPLFLILASNVDLGRAKMVVGHVSDGATTTVIAQDPKHPEYGTIQLVFTPNPVELRQWIITDSTGQRTTMILGKLALGGQFRRSLFSIDDEIEARGF
jgi:outer membrane lipoprotein-sorting protein